MTKNFYAVLLLLSVVGCSEQEVSQEAPSEFEVASGLSLTDMPSDVPAGEKSAKDLLAESILRAENEDKRVLVHFGATW